MIIFTMMTNKNKNYQRLDVISRQKFDVDSLIRISFDKVNKKFYPINSNIGGKGYYLLPTLSNFNLFKKRRFLERISNFQTKDCLFFYDELEQFIIKNNNI